MVESEHQRHKPPRALPEQCELLVACPPLRSNVNLSRIVRLASCTGVRRVIACGHAKIDPKIARDGARHVELQRRRSLAPALSRLGSQGYRLVGLEQATRSICLYDYRFHRRTVLVLGHERRGLDESVMQLLDDVVEIPVFGLPYSYNVVTAAAMALYEYCRQHGRVGAD